MISLYNILVETQEYCEEYTVENYHDIKEFTEFMNEYKSDINEAEYQCRVMLKSLKYMLITPKVM